MRAHQNAERRATFSRPPAVFSAEMEEGTAGGLNNNEANNRHDTKAKQALNQGEYLLGKRLAVVGKNVHGVVKIALRKTPKQGFSSGNGLNIATKARTATTHGDSCDFPRANPEPRKDTETGLPRILWLNSEPRKDTETAGAAHGRDILPRILWLNPEPRKDTETAGAAHRRDKKTTFGVLPCPL